MKSAKKTRIAALTLLAVLALPAELAAQVRHKKPHSRYSVQDLGTLGGKFSLAGGLNENGLVEGFSTLPGEAANHAVLWRNGRIIDLGTLGGPNSGAAYRPSDRGQVGGAAEITTPDPRGEDFCGFGTHLICLPLVWQKGGMTPLPTLGGPNGQADGFNNRGQVVGFAENDAPDPTCFPPQVLQIEAVIWEDGEIKEVLPRISGDSSAFAFNINDRGQAVGISGDCALLTAHAVLWRNGKVIDLGNFGGAFNIALAINSRGHVVGESDLAGDLTGHAFRWRKGVMTDLSTLPGDFESSADGINDQGQIVGGSFDQAGNSRAFLWENGVMTDLNTLIPADSPLLLQEATGGINSRGQIAGYALQKSTREIHAFLATPTGGEWKRDAGSSVLAARDATAQSPKVALPENARKGLRRGLPSERFRARLTKRQ